VVSCGETVTEPEVAFPVEKPEPVQLLALVADHVSVAFCPRITEEGFGVRDAVGTAAPTFTVTESVAVPDVPTQVSVYVVVFCGLTVRTPEASDERLPIPWFKAHVVAFVEE
jgi:hypothetical protein